MAQIVINKVCFCVYLTNKEQAILLKEPDVENYFMGNPYIDTVRDVDESSINDGCLEFSVNTDYFSFKHAKAFIKDAINTIKVNQMKRNEDEEKK